MNQQEIVEAEIIYEGENPVATVADAVEVTGNQGGNGGESAPPESKFYRFWGAASFALGFLSYGLLLNTAAQSSTLGLLSLYFGGALGALLLVGLNLNAHYSKIAAGVAQFGFGGIFKALAPLYFKSSASWGVGLLFVLGVLLLILVSWQPVRRLRLMAYWFQFTLSGVMYFNFLLPHLTRSAHGVWFVISSLLALLLAYGLWKLSKQSSLLLAAPAVVVTLFIASYFAELIPPVPLVLKTNIICKNFEKVDGEFTCMEPQQSLLQKIGWRDFEIHQDHAHKIYALTAVQGPEGVKAELEQRWLSWDETAEQWQYHGAFAFPVAPAKEHGWRLYSSQQELSPGLWRVETALKSGSALGYMQFRVLDTKEAANKTYNRRILR